METQRINQLCVLFASEPNMTSSYSSGIFHSVHCRSLTALKTRMRRQHQSLKTGQRMTEGIKKGAKQVMTGTEDDEAEILMIGPRSQGASLP